MKNVYFKRKLKFKRYQVPTTGIFVDNGHSMQFNPTDSSKHILRGGALMGKNKYEFLQFHFHWGSDDSHGSEHTVDGFRYYKIFSILILEFQAQAYKII